MHQKKFGAASFRGCPKLFAVIWEFRILDGGLRKEIAIRAACVFFYGVLFGIMEERERLRMNGRSNSCRLRSCREGLS